MNPFLSPKASVGLQSTSCSELSAVRKSFCCKKGSASVL